MTAGPNRRSQGLSPTFRAEYEKAAAEAEQLRADFAELAERYQRLMPRLTATTVLHRRLPDDPRLRKHAHRAQAAVDETKQALELLAMHLRAMTKNAREVDAQFLAEALRGGRPPSGGAA